MHVYRLSRKKYANAFSGLSASGFANRWNSKGTEIIYTSESRALALAEVVVHLSLAYLPSDFIMLEILIPEKVKISEINSNILPKNWNSFPHLTSTQFIGDQFIRESKYGVVKIPSAVVKGDFNFLINPRHPDFKKINITNQERFAVDQRLFS